MKKIEKTCIFVFFVICHFCQFMASLKSLCLSIMALTKDLNDIIIFKVVRHDEPPTDVFYQFLIAKNSSVLCSFRIFTFWGKRSSIHIIWTLK